MALSTRTQLKIHLICNHKILHQLIDQEISNNWPFNYQKLININPILIEDQQNEKLCTKRPFFPVGAMIRLFLHDILPQEDAVIYIDSDSYFLTRPEKMFDLFDQFDSKQIIGGVKNAGYYENPDLFHKRDVSKTQKKPKWHNLAKRIPKVGLK